MSTVSARAYLSPTLVLLAMDWPDGDKSPGRTEGSALDRGYSGLTMGIEAFIYNYLQHLPVRCQGADPKYLLRHS